MINVSVIVPAYNEEKYISKCLESLKKQTYKDFEIIVINNNSIDNTEEIAKQFVDKVVLETNKGYHNAVNRGARESNAKYITFCDADSIYPEDWLEKVMTEFEKDPNILAVYGGLKFYDHNFLVNFFSSYAYSLSLKISKMLGFDNTPGFNFVMKKDAYLQVGGYDPKIYDSILVDIELGKRLQQVGKLKQNTKIKVYTSSRRLKGDGIIKASLYNLEAWYRLNYHKQQKMSYKEYNKEFRDEVRQNKLTLRWINEINNRLKERNKVLNAKQKKFKSEVRRQTIAKTKAARALIRKYNKILKERLTELKRM
jgi:glycosyltransferase involved in cell wall biosynthesis